MRDRVTISNKIKIYLKVYLKNAINNNLNKAQVF